MKKIFLLISSFFILSNSFSQNSETLLTIDDQKISKEEFVRIYDKNKTNLSTGEVTSVDEYLDLFINFKLKVIEAEKLGLDTTPSFIKEFEGYKEQLTRPYLIDQKANEKIIKEAYDRMQYEVRASHILVKLSPDASPEDTAAAYKKALEIRRRIMNGEAFDVVAKGSSDDPSVKNNGGDLGYFTVFQMIYPFESAVYNSSIGDITMPVRTRFGYHIVKVTDKRKARGEVKVAHIMLTVPAGTSGEVEKQKKQLINEIYHKAMQGDDFAELAKEYSDDKGSARNGGELPWFGVGRMVPEFEHAAFSLTSNGEISQPVRTGFGWHIIKRIDRKVIPSFEDVRQEIEKKVGKDQRSDIAHRALINKLKKEYHFKEIHLPVVYDSIQNAYVVDLKYLESKSNLKDTLFTFQNKVYFEKDFADYVKLKSKDQNISAAQYKIFYDEFVDNKILEMEKSILEQKYPEYKYLLKEYHDGMLLFEITDQKVWSKAMNDTLGLQAFYSNHKKDYMWDERWEGSIYICSNEQVYNKVRKIINKGSFGRKITNQDLLDEMNKESEVLKIETGLFSKGDNDYVDKLIWKIKTNDLNTDLVLEKGKKISEKPKTLNEARGLVISDYQDYLEKEWVKNLKSKYNIQVNTSVLSEIKNGN